MSIFGTGNFMFTGTGTPDSTARTITYGVIEPQYQIGDLIELTNPLTGEKYYNLRGSYCELRVKIHVHKESAPSTFTQTMLSYLGQNVTNVKPRGSVILDDSSSNPVQFTVTKVDPLPLAENAEQDIIIMEFKSKKYVSLYHSL